MYEKKKEITKNENELNSLKEQRERLLTTKDGYLSDMKKIETKINKYEKEIKESQEHMQKLEKENKWIQAEVCFFGMKDTDYDFSTLDPKGEYEKLSKLKESGDLENAADNVYLVYRPEWFVGRNLKYPNMSQDWSKYSTEGTGLLIQAKGRNSGLGECLLGFDGPTTRYFDIEQESFKDPFHYDENLKAPY